MASTVEYTWVGLVDEFPVVDGRRAIARRLCGGTHCCDEGDVVMSLVRLFASMPYASRPHSVEVFKGNERVAIASDNPFHRDYFNSVGG